MSRNFNVTAATNYVFLHANDEATLVKKSILINQYSNNTALLKTR